MAAIRDVHTQVRYTGLTSASIVRRVYGRTAHLRPEHDTHRFTVVRRARRRYGDNAYDVLGLVVVEE